MECKIISYNVNGTNNPVKRAQIVGECKRLGAKDCNVTGNPVCVSGNVPQFKHYTNVYASNNPERKSLGVMILIHKDLPLVITDQNTDQKGRYVILKEKIAHNKITLANVYVPNSDQSQFICKFLDILATFAEGNVILGTDLNTPLNPLSDMSTKKSNLSYKGLKKVKKALNDMQLVEAWRCLNSHIIDYSHYSNTHQFYLSIDYLFVSHQWLLLCQEAK